MEARDAETMELGQRMATLLNDYPSDLAFAMLIRFTVQAAERQTESRAEALDLIWNLIVTDTQETTSSPSP